MCDLTVRPGDAVLVVGYSLPGADPMLEVFEQAGLRGVIDVVVVTPAVAGDHDQIYRWPPDKIRTVLTTRPGEFG